jgi:hypothetical protein
VGRESGVRDLDLEARARSLREEARGGRVESPLTGGDDSSELINGELIDPIPELEQQLMRVLRTGASERLIDGASVTGDLEEKSGPQNPATRRSEDRLQDEVTASRGAANFLAWRETRQQLDGNEAEFVIEYPGDDGSVLKVDLIRAKYEDLPAPIQAEFERHRFPDRDALLNISHGLWARQSKSATDSTSRGEESTSRTPDEPMAQREGASSIASEDVRAKAEDIADMREFDGPRYASVQGGTGFGINFGGFGRRLQRASRGTGHVPTESAGAAVNALARMREGLGLDAGKQGGWIRRRVRSWRDDRATQALERLAHHQAEFETALRKAQELPELKKHFRSWNVPRTATTRKRAVAKFHEALVSGNIGAEATSQIADLFERAEGLRVEADRAMQKVASAGHNVEDVQRGLAGWLKRVSERAGPLSNLEGEGLGEKLLQIADRISRLFEQVAERIARLSAVRPT